MPRKTLATLTCAALLAGCASAPSPQAPLQATPKITPPSPAAQAAPPTSTAPVDGPRIRLTSKEIRLDGAPVGWNPALVRDRLQKIDPLFTALRERQPADASAQLKGQCVFEIEPDVPFLAAASAIRTSAFAGCPVAWISTSAGWLELRTPPLLPLGAAPDADKPSPSRRQIALHVGPSLLDLTVFAVAPHQSDADREQLEPVLKRLVARDATGAHVIASALVEGCDGAPRPCPVGMWLTADENMFYGDVAGALAAIVEGQRSSSTGGAAKVLVDFRPPGSVPIDRVSPRLPPEQIQHVVRANFRVFVICYEEGLERNPNLKGRVNVRFVIGRDGRVTQASVAESASPEVRGPAAKLPPMPDEKVASCVAEGFKKLIFPEPEGGNVTVVYPIMFSPGN